MKIKRLYVPPFIYDHGAVRDANNERVLDIRGWGRIQYLKPDPEKMQDDVGRHVAKLLTEHWHEIEY